MKSMHLVVTALLAVGSLGSEAFAGNLVCGTQLVCRGHFPYRSCSYVYSCGHDACSPEVQASNLAAVDQTLTDLASKPEYSNSNLFLDKVRSIQGILNNEQKIAAYLGMAAIDPQNNEELVKFIYGREVPKAQLDAIQKNAGLSAAQAVEVATKLQAALRGAQQK